MLKSEFEDKDKIENRKVVDSCAQGKFRRGASGPPCPA